MLWLFVLLGIFGLMLMVFSVVYYLRKQSIVERWTSDQEEEVDNNKFAASSQELDWSALELEDEDLSNSLEMDRDSQIPSNTLLEERIARYEKAFPVFIRQKLLLPVLVCDSDSLNLEDREHCHFQSGTVFYEAELEDPVFTLDGELTDDNKKIFSRCLMESGVGRFFLTTGRIIFQNDTTTLMINIRNVEDFTVFERYLVVKELGLPSVSVFYIGEAMQVAAILQLLHKRRKLFNPK